MKKLFILSVSLVSLAVALSQCKTTKTTTVTTTTTPTPVPAPASSADMADISAGELLFTTKCDGCHKQPNARKHDDEGWAKTMAKMGPEAKLTEAETAQVLKYLHSAITR